MTRIAPPTLAIDAMGGDIGLDTTLPAVGIAQKRHPDLHFILVGDQSAIEQHPVFATLDKKGLAIQHASQIVTMDDHPSSVLRHKNDSSMWRAIELVRDGKAQACVSAGNTGALMGSARYILKMLPGISRPAICATVPSLHGHVHWLDLGANVDSKPEQLRQFAIMGSEVARAVDNIDKPAVGLLNIGEEAIKGNDVVKETGKLLEQSNIRYIGFVEGNDIFLRPDLNVVVCDGFVGNIALKTVEGLAKFIQREMEKSFRHNLWSKVGALFALPALKRVKGRIDPRAYNGASIVGLQGVVVKSHGNADSFAYANAINIARLEIERNVIGRIRDQLQQTASSDENASS